jgi:hypothetical protein
MEEIEATYIQQLLTADVDLSSKEVVGGVA